MTAEPGLKEKHSKMKKTNEHIEYWEKVSKESPVWEPDKIHIPPKYKNYSFDNFKGNPTLITKLSEYEGGGLIIKGNTGCGKTHLAISIMRHFERNEWIEHCKENIQRINDGRDLSTKQRSNKLFLSIPELFLQIRESFRDSSKVSEMDLLDKYSYVPFLILDDLGLEKTGEYSISTLYLLLNRRDSYKLNTIITTNL